MTIRSPDSLDINRMSKDKSKIAPKEKFNFVPWIITAVVLVLLFGGLIIYHYVSDYVENYREVLKFTYSDGKYYDEKNDITYVAAPMCYSFNLKSGEEYEYAKSESVSFYYVGYKDVDGTVHMKDPTAWLTTSYDEGAIIYYNPEKVTLPETKNFRWNGMYLCNTDGTVFATQELDFSVTDRLLDAYFDAPEEDNRFDERFDMSYIKEVRVTSSEYPHLHMIMRLYDDGKGGYFLCSVYDNKMVQTDSAVFAPFFEDKKE